MRIYLPRIIAWATLLILAIGCVAMLSSCASHRPPTAAPVTSAPIAADTARTPLGHVSEPKRTLLDKVLGRTPDISPLHKEVAPYITPKKCKGCTFNLVGGDQTNAGKKATVQAEGATNVGKNKGPLATGEARATDQSGTGAASTIEGNGNAPVLTNTAPPERSWQEAIADNLTGPIGWGLGVLLLVVVGVKLGPWLLAAWKRNRDTDTPTV